MEDVTRNVRTYEHFCQVARTLERVGDRWSLLVIRDLLTGAKRFTDLMDRLGGITPKTLSQRLRDLQDTRIITAHRDHPSPDRADLHRVRRRHRHHRQTQGSRTIPAADQHHGHRRTSRLVPSGPGTLQNRMFCMRVTFLQDASPSRAESAGRLHERAPRTLTLRDSRCRLDACHRTALMATMVTALSPPVRGFRLDERATPSANHRGQIPTNASRLTC